MLTKTSFQFLLEQTTANELNGVVLNASLGGLQCHRYDVPLIDGYFVPGAIIVEINNDNKDECLTKTLKTVFRTKLHYSFKTNSLNFNLGELPFQTYRGYINQLDAEGFIKDIKDKSIKEFEDLVKLFINHYPEERLVTWLIKNLTAIGDLEKFNDDDFNTGLNHFTSMPGVNLNQNDVSRISNQMLYIVAYANALPKGTEFLKAYLIHRKQSIVLDKLRHS